MFNVPVGMSWLGIAAAVLAVSVLGGLWFTVLFGRLYAVALGRVDALKEKPAPIFFIGPMICNVVTTVTTAILIRALGVRSVGEAVSLGTLVGLGYLAATTVNTAINPNIPRPLLYGAISGGYFFVASLITTSLLVLIH